MKLLKTYFLTLPLAFGLLLGCDVKKSEDEDGSSNTDTGSVITLSAVTSGAGRASTSFSLPAGTNKFGIVAESSRNVRFDVLNNSNGESYLANLTEEISFATEFASGVNTASAPSRDFDPSVSDALTYSVTATAASSSGASFNPLIGETVRFSIISKQDKNFNKGDLRLNVLYVGGIVQASDSRAAVRAALDEMASIYSQNAGISLDIHESDIAGPNNLPDPSDGSTFYRAASGTVSSPAVNIFIGSDVDSSFGSGRLLGISASIPGPPIPSIRSAVAVSLLTSAGGDGVFSSDEIRVLGETLAHESGHFLGLYHPVEIDSRSGLVAGEDPLPDTDTCNSAANCNANPNLAQNLMYPFPVSNGAGGTLPQNLLSPQQRGVMNRYIAVD